MTRLSGCYPINGDVTPLSPQQVRGHVARMQARLSEAMILLGELRKRNRHRRRVAKRGEEISCFVCKGQKAPKSVDVVRLIKKASKEDRKLEGRILKAYEQGDLYTVRGLTEKRLHSLNARICAVVDVNKAAMKKGHKSLRPEKIVAIARDIDVNRAPVAWIGLKLIAKKKGGRRPIYSFKIRDKARQHLIMRVLRPLLPVDPHQHWTSNGGRQEAMRRLHDTVQGSRHKYVATGDVSNCFPSINREWVKQDLSRFLRKEVIGDILFLEGDQNEDRINLPPIEDDNDLSGHIGYEYDLWDACRSGLPQGACSSPVIAEYVIGEVIAGVQMPAGTDVVISADDVAITGRPSEGVERAISTLRDAFMRHPAGDFRLTFSDVHRIADGFDFLGYAFRRRKGVEPVRPSEANMRKFKGKAAGWLHDILTGDDPAKVLRSMRGWCNGFGNVRDALGAVTGFLMWGRRCRDLRDKWPIFSGLMKPFSEMLMRSFEPARQRTAAP